MTVSVMPSPPLSVEREDRRVPPWPLARRSPRLAGWLVLLLLGALPATCPAVIILEKGSSEPLRGYLVDKNDVRVIVDVLQPDGELRRRILTRSSIDELLEAVSQERLAALHRDRPQEYRDYAEELAGKTNDPDAQKTAIRLYQIAAYLAPDKLGRSCLLGMVALARTPEEARKFRAAAYLLDKDHNRSILRPYQADAKQEIALNDEQRKHARTLLRALRDGRVTEAKALAKRPALQDPLQRLAPLLTVADFEGLREGESLPPAVLYKVLAAELAIDPQAAAHRPGETREDKSPPGAASWSKLEDPKATAPVPVLALERLTEFDPRQCHFRNGKWEP